jgi:hypothetical protein
MTTKYTKEVENAFNFGYKLFQLAHFMEGITVSGMKIPAKNLAQTRKEVEKQLLDFDEYTRFFFKKPLAQKGSLKTQKDIAETMMSIASDIDRRLRVHKAKHIYSAFHLGRILALDTMAPPAEADKENTFRLILRDLRDINAYVPGIDKILNDLMSEDEDTRLNAHRQILDTVRGALQPEGQ